MKCNNCNGKIKQGQNTTQVTEGIHGVEDFVSLDKPLHFCSTACLRDFFSETKQPLHRLKRKIP